MKKVIELIVNGQKQELLVAPNELLPNVLRNRLGLTGAKYGCGVGECFACTVLADGKPLLACLTLPISLDGREITTIEGIAKPDGRLDPLLEGFLQSGAGQCGFCTPGMILIGRSLLSKNSNPTEREIREYIRGNTCRCIGYVQIVKAIEDCMCPPEEV